jgi:hypothetical protein
LTSRKPFAISLDEEDDAVDETGVVRSKDGGGDLLELDGTAGC